MHDTSGEPTGIRPAFDPARLAAVARTGLLDTDAEEDFDRLAALASHLLRAPFAFLTVVDEQRSFWKARLGIPPEGPRQNTLEESFCQYVVDSEEPLVLGDVRDDPRTKANPSIESMGVVAWAGYPVRTPEGHVMGTLCVVDTEERQWTEDDVAVLSALAEIATREVELRVTAVAATEALEAADRERRRAQLLARIGELLTAGLDLDAVWRAVVGLTVPALADYGFIHSLSADEGLVPQACAHRDPGREDELAALMRASVRSVGDDHGPGRVAVTGRSELIPDLSAVDGLSGAQRESRARMQAASSITVPLRARGELIAVLTVVRSTGSPPYTTDDLHLVEAIAARAALAIDNALAYDLERNLSLHLQEALLPSRLEQPDGLAIATRYQPAGSAQAVGGDWYDAFVDLAGATTVVIGDVAGHDIHAATTMGQLRTMVRMAGHDGTATPAGVLEAVDENTGAVGFPVFATALVARLDRLPEGSEPGRLTWSSAGHLPPLLVPPGRPPRLLDGAPDRPLGCGAPCAGGRRDRQTELPPGATLLLYTDGLVERRGEDLDAGMQRLVDVVGEVRDLPVGELCDAVLARMPTDGDDDVALLAVRALAARR